MCASCDVIIENSGYTEIEYIYRIDINQAVCDVARPLSKCIVRLYRVKRDYIAIAAVNIYRSTAAITLPNLIESDTTPQRHNTTRARRANSPPHYAIYISI